MRAEFAKYSLLKLYCDTVPKEYYPPDQRETVTKDRRKEDARKHAAFEIERFNTNELPLYVVLESTETDFREVARYSVGLIRDREEFLRFLREHVR